MDADRIIFNQSIPTLQKLAAHATALPIWQNYVLQSAHYKRSKDLLFGYEDSLHGIFELCDEYWTENDELIKRLDTPSAIENILITSSRNIRNETRDWIFSFGDIVFAESLRKYSYRVRRIDIMNCCWTHNLKIDYVRTISNILSMAELSEVQKFIIYCKYCMVNEITSFPQRTLRWNTVKILRTDTLLNYWICQLRNETFKMSDRHLSDIAFFFGNPNVSVDIAMAYNCNYCDDFGFEYFWDRLGADDQVTVASKILCSDAKHQMRVLSMMSMVQQRQLVCIIPGGILQNFILYLDMWQNAVLVWQKMKYEILEREFCILITNLFNHEMYGYRSEDRSEKCDAFLLYVWETAPDHLRNYILGTEIDSIVGKFFYKYHLHTASGLKFLHRLLSLKSAEYRKQLILDNAIRFVTNVPIFEPRLTIDLFELCLPNNNDRSEFQRLVFASDAVRKHYETLIHSGKVREMNVKLNIFSPKNIIDVRNLKKLLLEFNLDVRVQLNNYGYFYITNFTKWMELDECIEEAFADASLASSFKKRFLFAFAEKCSMPYWSYPDRMDEIIKVVEYGLSPNDVEIFKQIVMNKLREAILSRNNFLKFFEKNSFLKNVLWCLGDEEAVQEFINVVPARLLR